MLDLRRDTLERGGASCVPENAMAEMTREDVVAHIAVSYTHLTLPTSDLV